MTSFEKGNNNGKNNNQIQFQERIVILFSNGDIFVLKVCSANLAEHQDSIP